EALRSASWPQREAALMAASEQLAAMHNRLAITEPVPTSVHRLWDRPFRVLWGDFPGALRAQIREPEVQRIADRWPTGGVDQFRDIAFAPRYRRLLRRLFE